jgi:hypothetical protein
MCETPAPLIVLRYFFKRLSYSHFSSFSYFNFAESGCAGLMRQLCSRGTITDGTISRV